MTKRIILVKWFVCPLLFFWINNLFSQQYNFRNYSVKDGVAQSQVYCLLQDSRGFLWMGTRGGGLTRYDGINFKTYTVKDGLANNYIFDIREGPDGRLWIGTNNGLSVYNGVFFKNYIPPGDSGQVWIQKIDFDKKGRAWLASNNGILMLDTGKVFVNISEKIRQRKTLISAILVDGGGNVWFGNAMGLYRIKENKGIYWIDKFNRSPGFLNNSITTLKKDAYGNLWVGTYGDGVYIFKKGKFRRFDINNELQKQTILDICFDAGTTWLATLQKGVAQYSHSGGSFSWLGEEEGLANNHVRSIIRDKSGNYWFGTSGGGVCNYFGKQFTHYDKSSGLAGNYIYSIFRDSRKRLWIGTSDKGLSVYDSLKFYNYDFADGLNGLKIKAIGEDTSGVLFFGTDGQGLYSFDGSKLEPIEELNRRYIRAIASDGHNKLWVATAGHGLYCLQKENRVFKINQLTTENGLLHNRLTCLHIDKKGRVWYGTENNGLACIENDSVAGNSITVKNGLPSNAIRSITEDQRGLLWIATAGYGVCSIKLYDAASRATCLDHNNGLASSNIYLLVTDKRDNLFAGSETGLDYIMLNNDGQPEGMKHYGKGEGFTGIETCQNSVFRDNDGTIWFGTINGLSKYNPANHVYNKNEPVTSITDIKLFYESIANTPYKKYAGDWNKISELELPYDQNRITFDFMAINFSNPEAVKYQWMLEGFDREWSPVSRDRSISYSNLGAGDYTFKLRACNEDGVWNKKPLRYSFRIRPPFWLSWWFIATGGIFVSGLVFGFFRWRINRVKAKAKETQDKLKLEKEIVELEQKALRLQMNPHFIFNALNSIQSQIGTDNDQTARYYLAKFSRLMRQILDNSRNTFITLDEEINTLENYLLIEKFCNDSRFDYSIKVDKNLEADFIKIPPMLLQPFVENSIKHGLKNIPGRKGFVEVCFNGKNGFLECSITDNGIGRKKSEEVSKAGKEKYHKSTAIIVTKERLSLLKTEELDPTLEIIDLYDEMGMACGTLVLLKVPM